MPKTLCGFLSRSVESRSHRRSTLNRNVPLRAEASRRRSSPPPNLRPCESREQQQPETTAVAGTEAAICASGLSDARQARIESDGDTGGGWSRRAPRISVTFTRRKVLQQGLSRSGGTSEPRQSGQNYDNNARRRRPIRPEDCDFRRLARAIKTALFLTLPIPARTWCLGAK